MPTGAKTQTPKADALTTPAHQAARLLSPLTLINTFGNGLFRTNNVLFFTHFGGMTTTQFGAGLVAGGVCGVFASMPFGRIADRWGARRVLIVLWCAEAVGVLGYTQVRSFETFVALICPITAVERGAVASYRALLATALPPNEVMRARAKLRALNNVGVGLGGAVGALALAVNTLAAYATVMVVDCLSFVVAATMLARLPDSGTDLRGAGKAVESDSRRSSVFRDRRYVLLTVVCGLLALQFGVLDIGLPLWVVHDTTAPRVTVAAALVLNTALVALLQVRLSRGSEDPAGAARLGVWAGWLLALGCTVFVLTRSGSTDVASAMVLLAVLVFSIAEIYFAASSTALSYGLGPGDLAGTYQGLFQCGSSTAALIAPVLMTGGILRFPLWGWLALGALFATAGASLPWISRQRPCPPP